MHFSYSTTKGILYDAPSENNMSNAQEVRRSGGRGGGGGKKMRRLEIDRATNKSNYYSFKLFPRF